ncbi:MAG TPA: hypothetical protein PK916_02790 [Bacteroidota bacterium]|nr:hypothetical protein [Bacteroidota bacterium]
MRISYTSLLLALLLAVSASAQRKPDVYTVIQLDPTSCCYESRLQNLHTPPSPLNELHLRILTPGFTYQPGVSGPWPLTLDSDIYVVFGEQNIRLMPNEALDGIVFCITPPPQGDGKFQIEWKTTFNGADVTVDTVDLVCKLEPPALDSLRVTSTTAPNQPNESCVYDITLKNRNQGKAALNDLHFTILTPGASFVGTQSGPWNAQLVNPTTLHYVSAGAVLDADKDLAGFRLFVRPPNGQTGGVVMRWESTINGTVITSDVLNLACTPKQNPRCDSAAAVKQQDCSALISVFNKHRPESNLDGVRISIVSTGASIQTVTPPSGWTIFSQSGLNLWLKRSSGVLAPNDSVKGIAVTFKPSSTGLVRFAVCTMFQSNTVCCDTLSIQCDPPPPSTCDSVTTLRVGTDCTYNFGFVNKHVPAGAVNDFHLRMQSPGVSITSAVAPDGWVIERQTATEIVFKDTVGVVAPGEARSGFLVGLRAGDFGSTVVYEWCTSLNGTILCCEFAAVSCEQLQTRCDSVTVTPSAERCTYTVDLSNLHTPESDVNGFRIVLRNPLAVLLAAQAPEGWSVTVSNDQSEVLFQRTDGVLATGEHAQGFQLSLVPPANSRIIPLRWCTELNGQELCCDTLSVYCDNSPFTPDKIDVLVDPDRPCCFELKLNNEHLPKSNLTALYLDILSNGVIQYQSTIQAPPQWTFTTSSGSVNFRGTSDPIPFGESRQGFTICYDNDASGEEEFLVRWSSVSDGLIISSDSLRLRCTQTLWIREVPGARPTQAVLHQNFPNPFNPVTTVRFDVADAGYVELGLYDLLGRKVMDLGSGHYHAGSWQVMVDARTLPSGTYVYRMRSGDTELQRSMVVTK